MALTSSAEDWEKAYRQSCDLPPDDRSAIFSMFSRLCMTSEWRERFNHELLCFCHDKHMVKVVDNVIGMAAEEYQETLRAMELWEELL